MRPTDPNPHISAVLTCGEIDCGNRLFVSALLFKQYCLTQRTNRTVLFITSASPVTSCVVTELFVSTVCFYHNTNYRKFAKLVFFTTERERDVNICTPAHLCRCAEHKILYPKEHSALLIRFPTCITLSHFLSIIIMQWRTEGGGLKGSNPLEIPKISVESSIA